MPNQLELQVQAGTLPGGACPLTGDWQGVANLLASIFSVTFPSTFSGVTASTSPPSDQTQTWLQLDANGRPVRVYYFAAGAWVSQHPLVPGFVMIWPFALPDFTTFDGGDANTASAVSGPMWQQAQDGGGNLILQAQFPIGAGNLPSGTVVPVGGMGGEEKHVLAVNEMPPHIHNVTQFNPAGISAGSSTATYFPGTNQNPIPTTTTGGDPNTGNPPTSALAHNTLPPYYGVYFLQRTGRLFYAAN